MNKSTRNSLKWLGLAAGLIVIVLAMMFMAQPDGGGLDGSEISENEWIKGNPDAAVTIVEYSDFQCPACQARLAAIEPIISEFANHVRFVYRHFPLRSIHVNAQMAAQASEAAGLQGQFWEMHDTLFARQDEWSNLTTKQAKEMFMTYAEGLGLDMEKFEDDIDSKAVVAAVNDDASAGRSAGVSSTPSFFLNGEFFNLNSDAQTRQAVRDAIDQSKL